VTRTLHGKPDIQRSDESPSLEDAIAQQINLGIKDPLEIARNIEKLYGTAWMGEQLVAYAEDLVAGMARMRLGATRRSAERRYPRRSRGRQIVNLVVSTHTLHPDTHEHGLADDCPRCAEHAEYPFLSLDRENQRALLIRVNLDLPPRSLTEARAMLNVVEAMREVGKVEERRRKQKHPGNLRVMKW